MYQQVKNIELTKEQYKYLKKNYIKEGKEGVIIPIPKQRIVKLLKSYPEEDANKAKKIRENKLQKILCLSQQELENPIRIMNLLSYEHQFVGYITSSCQGKTLEELRNVPFALRVEILKQCRKILLDFHANDIIYGDINMNNIGYNAETDQTFYYDLDNVAYKNYPIDKLNLYAQEYLKTHKKIDRDFDIYLLNLLASDFLSSQNGYQEGIAYLINEKNNTGVYQKGNPGHELIKVFRTNPKTKPGCVIDHL